MESELLLRGSVLSLGQPSHRLAVSGRPHFQRSQLPAPRRPDQRERQGRRVLQLCRRSLLRPWPVLAVSSAGAGRPCLGLQAFRPCQA